MQKVKIFLLVIIFSFVNLSLFSDNSNLLEEWLYSKPITITEESNYRYVFLDKEVYQYADSTLKDIRIVDKNNEFVPYYLSIESREENLEEIEFSSALINTYHDDEGNSFFDFHFLPILEEEVRGKKIILDIYESDYSRQVVIYGREEKTDWVYITQDTVYDIDGIRKNEIEFDNLKDYDLYRIKIVENNNEISIRGCTLIFNELQQFYHQFVKTEALDFNIDTEANLTLIEINNTFHLRLINLDLDINENFDRTYDVFKETEEEHTKIQSGRMYYMQFKDINIIDTEIDFSRNPLSYEKFVVQINNQDNRPLNIERINAEYFIDKIVFEDIGTGPYALYFGNESALKPEYDIVNFKSYIDDEEQLEVSLGSTVVLKAGGKAEELFDYKLIFNILIIAVAVILIVFLAFVLKKK